MTPERKKWLEAYWLARSWRTAVVCGNTTAARVASRAFNALGQVVPLAVDSRHDLFRRGVHFLEVERLGSWCAYGGHLDGLKKDHKLHAAAIAEWPNL